MRAHHRQLVLIRFVFPSSHSVSLQPVCRCGSSFQRNQHGLRAGNIWNLVLSELVLLCICCISRSLLMLPPTKHSRGPCDKREAFLRGLLCCQRALPAPAAFLWTLMHRWSVWWLFFSPSTPYKMSVCGSVRKRLGLKLESNSGPSLHSLLDKTSADLKPDIFMTLYRTSRLLVSMQVPGLIVRLSGLCSSGIWTNRTNWRTALCLAFYSFSARVSPLSSGYRGPKGERGQLGFGLPGDPGEMGPPGKEMCIKHDKHDYNNQCILCVLKELKKNLEL